MKNLVWHFQSGKRILIGKDTFLSGSEEIVVPESFLAFLHRRGIFFWDGLISEWLGPIPMWRDADSLQMPNALAAQWAHLRIKLRNSGIFLLIGA